MCLNGVVNYVVVSGVWKKHFHALLSPFSCNQVSNKERSCGIHSIFAFTEEVDMKCQVVVSGVYEKLSTYSRSHFIIILNFLNVCSTVEPRFKSIFGRHRICS